MTKIIGTKPTAFTPKDSDRLVEGVTFYTVEELPAGKGEGCITGKFFLSTKKMAELDFTPMVGDSIELLYNRWGKINSVRQVIEFDPD